MSEPKENDGEHAREMLAMARKDLEALEKDMPEARPKIVEQVKRLIQHVDRRLAEA